MKMREIGSQELRSAGRGHLPRVSRDTPGTRAAISHECKAFRRRAGEENVWRERVPSLLGLAASAHPPGSQRPGTTDGPP